MTDTQRPVPKLPDPYPPAKNRSKLWLLITLQALCVGALLAVIAYYSLVATGPAAAPQPTITVTTTVTPKPAAPSRIVTLEDIIQGCANAMGKAGNIPLYTDRPKACIQLGEPEFQRASAIAIPLIMAQYDTPAP